MRIDKDKLKLGLWYEDENGNVIPHDNNSVEPPKGAATYHTQWPLEVREDIYRYYDNKETCRHPLRYRERTFGWIKGIKGCKCKACGKEKVGKKWIPFVFMPWEDGASSVHILTGSTHISRGSEDVILAMVNSGDYTLSEAIIVYASACERCMNVLCYKYLDGKDGYPEYSEEWKKCNTVCDFCKGDAFADSEVE